MRGRTERLVNDFLGSAQIFSSAIDELLTAEMRAVAVDGLTVAQLKILQFVARTTPTVSDIAAFLGVSTAAASKGVDRLVKRGLLKRRESRRDRRAFRISLTAAGVGVLEGCLKIRERVLERLFGDCSVEELRRSARLLDRFSLRIVQEEASPDELCFRCGVFFRDRCLLREIPNRVCHRHRHLSALADVAESSSRTSSNTAHHASPGDDPTPGGKEARDS